MKLSILICSITNRADSLLKLIEKFSNQITDEVEILSLMDNKKMSLGKKMNYLRSIAQGEYITFFDDDDLPSDDYVSSLLNAMQSKPDVVVFDVIRYVSGMEDLPANFSIEFKQNQNLHDRYLRIPNHIMCFKKELSCKIMFEDKNFGIDTIFAESILPLIKTETKINKTLYHYYFDAIKSEVNP